MSAFSSRIFRGWVAKGLLLFAVSLSGFLSACSPSSLFGESEDKGITERLPLRPVNPACANLDLSGERGGMTVQSFRSLVRCMNAFGALEPFNRLLDHMPDSDVRVMVELLNDEVFRQPRVLYDLTSTYQTLKGRNLVALFGSLAKLFENEKLIAALVRVGADNYYQSGPTAARKWGELSTRTPNRKLLKALSRLGDALSPEVTLAALEFIRNVAESKAYDGLVRQLQLDLPNGITSRLAAQALMAYANDYPDPKHVNAGRELVRFSITGDLFKALDAVTGQTADELRARLPRMSALPKAMFEGNAWRFNGISSLMNYANGAVSCVVDSQRVENTAFFIVNQLATKSNASAATFLARDSLLTLAASNPLCKFPPELARFYPTMADFAETTAIDPMMDLIRSLYSATDSPGKITRSPLLDFFVGLLADTGSGLVSYPGSGGRDQTGVKRLVPILIDLDRRDLWDHLFLVLSGVSLEDRQQMIKALIYLYEPVAELGDPGVVGREKLSILDVLAESFRNTSWENLADVIRESEVLIDRPDAVLRPILRELRLAHLSNDVWPTTAVVRSVLRSLDASPARAELLFKVALAPETKEAFEQSMGLLSRILVNGQFQEILETTLSLFERSARVGAHPITQRTPSPFVRRGRHDWRQSDLDPYPIKKQLSNATDGCRRLPADFRIDRPEISDYAQNLAYLGDCLAGQDGVYRDGQKALEFLAASRTEGGISGLEQLIRMAQFPGLTTPDAAVLSDGWIRAYDDGRFSRFLKAAPLLLLDRPDRETLLRPLVTVLGPVTATAAPRDDLESIWKFSAKTLRRPEIPELLTYAEKIWDKKPGLDTTPKPRRFDVTRIKRWISNKECQRFPNDPMERELALEAAAFQAIDDFDHAVSNWDLVEGRPRRTWKLEEFKALADPILAKLGDPTHNAPGKSVSQALLNIVGYFSLKPGEAPNIKQHYARSDLLRWLKDRSEDYRLITYYYPGESRPRVRLMNTLDRLETILIESDYRAPWPVSKNYSLKFIQDLGDAWGDEPEELWPAEIKERYRGKKRPPTLAQAVGEMEKTLDRFQNLLGVPGKIKCEQVANPDLPPGDRDNDLRDPSGPSGLPDWFPTKPSIASMKRQLYNTRSVISVLRENLPGVGGRYDGGMRVLRDIFYELNYSTPEKDRDSSGKNPRNNLEVATRMSRLGIFRQVGRLLSQVDPQDPVVVELFEALIDSSISGKTVELFDALFREDPKRALAWSLLGRLFAVVDGADTTQTLRLRQAGLYALPVLRQLGILDLAVESTIPLVRAHREFLSRQGEVFEWVFKREWIGDLLQAFYEDDDQDSKRQVQEVIVDALRDPRVGIDTVGILARIDADPKSKDAWEVVKARWEVIEASPEYQKLDLSAILEDLLHFAQSRDPATRSAVRKMLMRWADLAEAKDLEQVLVLVRRHPDEIAQALETLSRAIENDDIPKFFDQIRQGLSRSQ